MFKIGDKICVINYPEPNNVVGKIGVIINVYPETSVSSFPYRIKLDDGWESLVYISEIEKVHIKSQQLLFEFMSEAI